MITEITLTVCPGDSPPSDEGDKLVWYDECNYANFGRGHFDMSEQEWSVNDWPGGRVLFWAEVPTGSSLISK